MRVFSEAAVLEKNRLASDAPFLIFLEIENPSIGEIRLVRNTENIQWQGKEWQAFPLDIETSSEDGKTIPALNVKVSNCGGIIQTYLQQYNGLVDSGVRLMVALASNLANPNPEFELDFLIKSASYDESWVTFCLSASAELMNRFPAHRYINNFCSIAATYAAATSERGIVSTRWNLASYRRVSAASRAYREDDEKCLPTTT